MSPPAAWRLDTVTPNRPSTYSPAHMVAIRITATAIEHLIAIERRSASGRPATIPAKIATPPMGFKIVNIAVAKVTSASAFIG